MQRSLRHRTRHKGRRWVLGKERYNAVLVVCVNDSNVLLRLFAGSESEQQRDCRPLCEPEGAVQEDHRRHGAPDAVAVLARVLKHLLWKQQQTEEGSG